MVEKFNRTGSLLCERAIKLVNPIGLTKWKRENTNYQRKEKYEITDVTENDTENEKEYVQS